MIRIGIMYPTSTPLSPRSWSGTPAGLAGGFREIGAEVIPIGAYFGLPLRAFRAASGRAGRHGGAVADRCRTLRELRTRVMAASVRSSGQLDAVVGMGTDMYDLGRVMQGARLAYTYDDATLWQMLCHDQSDLKASGLPAFHVETWIDQQRRSSQAADGCFVSSSWAGASFERDYGIDPDDISIVGMGHHPRISGAAQRDWTRPRYLFVGLDWERKNGGGVLEAFRQVRETVPTATLDIVGIDLEIPEKGVTMHGVLPRDDQDAQRQLADLYAAATCFVLPSRFDPAGIAYLEAGSAGLPVVATTEGGAKEMLGEGAIVVDPSSSADIAAAMLRLADPSAAKRWGSLSAAAAGRSSWKDVAGRMLDRILQDAAKVDDLKTGSAAT